jgi:hypothetical protein
MRHTSAEDGTVGPNLMRETWSREIGETVYKVSTHHFCQSRKEGTSYQRHQRQH